MQWTWIYWKGLQTVKQWDFKHYPSNLYYLKSNGQIEQTIQTIKTPLKKAFKSNGDSYLALLDPRKWPGPNNNTPSATLLYRRPIRTILPSTNLNIAIKDNKISRRSNSNQYNYTNLPQLNKNDKVDYMMDKPGRYKEKLFNI